MSSAFRCCDDRRRAALLAQTGSNAVNGIDWLEVVDHEAQTPADRQRILRVHFVRPPAPAPLTVDNVVVDGGERIVGIQADAVSYDGDVLVVHLTSYGDYSPYVLRLVDPASGDPLPSLDPLLAQIEFFFKVECPTDLDCRQDVSCAPAKEPVPEINYLAKDYDAFRRLMLDRMALIMPAWTERNAADLGVTLVEVLAYVADHLSYQQDAVATEAYLSTARRRISVRRHARLVDYSMHDGCNARAWVCFDVSSDSNLARGTQLLTRLGDAPNLVPPGSRLFDEAMRARSETFETMHDAALHAAHGRISFYAWGAENCCLPKGATRATLAGHFPALSVGDVLIFEEVVGPDSGLGEDADPTHRHVVRLTKVAATKDPIGGQFQTPPNANAVDVTEIAWADDDALPFALCVSSTTDESHGSRVLSDVSVARGNVVLVDHGRTITDEDLGAVPAPDRFRAPPVLGEHCAPKRSLPILPRFTPRLSLGPLTQAASIRTTKDVGGQEVVQTIAFDPGAPAAQAMQWSMSDVLPVISLASTGSIVAPWQPQRDLIDSDPFSTDFVAEVDELGIASLRFGDDEYGLRPDAGTRFSATYRVGVGIAGNVGPESITRAVSVDPAIVSLRNPLAARGGVDPEPVEHVRQFAPVAFQTQERAVTQGDWAEVTRRRADVLRAAATFRWTGSWHTVFDTVERPGAVAMDDAFRKTMLDYLEHYRVVGRDLEVDDPIYVPLDVALSVCVKRDYFRSDVKRALLAVFNDRVSSDGTRGLFHPDNFTFGQTIYASPWIAAAQAVEGVDSVELVRFHRRGFRDPHAIARGFLDLDRLEIARLDDDPDFPEHGRFELVMRGGQ